jgi:hypothetical protein
LRATQRKDIHVDESLVVHLEHGRLIRVSAAGAMREGLARGGTKQHESESERFDFHLKVLPVQ